MIDCKLAMLPDAARHFADCTDATLWHDLHRARSRPRCSRNSERGLENLHLLQILVSHAERYNNSVAILASEQVGLVRAGVLFQRCVGSLYLYHISPKLHRIFGPNRA